MTDHQENETPKPDIRSRVKAFEALSNTDTKVNSKSTGNTNNARLREPVATTTKHLESNMKSSTPASSSKQTGQRSASYSSNIATTVSSFNNNNNNDIIDPLRSLQVTGNTSDSSTTKKPIPPPIPSRPSSNDNSPGRIRAVSSPPPTSSSSSSSTKPTPPVIPPRPDFQESSKVKPTSLSSTSTPTSNQSKEQHRGKSLSPPVSPKPLGKRRPPPPPPPASSQSNTSRAIKPAELPPTLPPRPNLTPTPNLTDPSSKTPSPQPKRFQTNEKKQYTPPALSKSKAKLSRTQVYSNLYKSLPPPSDPSKHSAAITYLWLRSGLSITELSHIWSNADPNKTGTLTESQFIKAMQQIQLQIQQQEKVHKKPSSRSSQVLTGTLIS